MLSQDQLEIIRANGEIEFYVLDPARGVTNIGRHPENDIVIDGPNVALFHAMLDHRQKPFHLVLLSHDGQTRLGGQLLPANISRPLLNWDSIEVDGHTIILVEGNGVSAAPGPTTAPGASFQPAYPEPTASPGSTAAVPARPAPVLPPVTRPEPIPASGGLPGASLLPVPAAPAGGYFTSRPPDQADDVIITELSIREATVDVEQVATYQLTIINGGDLVAMFVVGVQGIPVEWVQLSRPYVNLNEGDRTILTITISPPRQPASRAGAHHLAVVVTSPNYPGRLSQRGATLTINPYYEFAVGELSPRQQAISWFKRSGEVMLPIINRSNTPALFQVDGTDDERACSFEFQVPGEAVNLARQAELSLQPNESISIPVSVIPHSRQLLALRRRAHAFTLTTIMLGAAQTPRSILGQLRQSPLLGPLHVLVMALLVAFLVVLIFRPYIRLFAVDGSRSKVITAGQAVTLTWNASPFARLIIPELGPAPLESPQGKVTAVPTANISYELRAENWLSRLSPGLFGVEPQVVTVILTPIPPEIQLFDGDRDNILSGDNINLSWLVKNADTVTLINQADGNIKPLTGASGTLDTGPLERETTYVLEASNPYISTPVRSDPFVVRVSTPTPTPLPTPAIVKFFANPPVIVAGESTTLEWEVQGTNQVGILGIGEGLPAIQTISQSPQETTNYVLRAANGPVSARPLSIVVYVTPAPTATSVPNAPEIVFFTAESTELVQGKEDPEEDEKLVSLSWLIEGTVTNVELNAGPDIGTFSNLDFPEGVFTVNAAKNTVFVLTAFNQDKTSSKTLQIEVLQATPTPSPVPTGTPPPTSTPTPPPPNIFFFKVEASNAADASKVVSLGNDNYRVEVGTNIKLSWQVSTDATQVTLSPGNNSFGPGTNFVEILDYSASDPGQYQLIAQNDFGASQKSVSIQVAPKPIPQPPSTVNGALVGSDNNISWAWAGSEDIAGFRVYRADVPPGNNFSAVHDAGPDPPFEWTDAGAGCGKIYYVVTLYFDENLDTRETGASGTSWSSPCP